MAVKVWRTSDKLYGNGYSAYQTPEGSAEILDVWVPTSAYAGDHLAIYLNVMNNGANDNFKAELVGDFTGLQLFSLGANSFLSFSFPINAVSGDYYVMPNKNVSLTINVYHEEGTEWKKDDFYNFVILLELAEGFLDITGTEVSVYCPHIGAVLGTLPKAHAGDTINLTVHTKNTGADDNFKVELTGDITGLSEFSLGAGLTKDVPFSFTMLNKNVSITINTYHWEEAVGWVWDVSSTWDVNTWF